MFYLWLIVSTALSFSFANPIPSDSDDLILNPNTVLLNSDVDAESNVDTVNELASSSFSPNEAIIANSIPVTGSGCASDVSMNDGFNVDIQKRKMCPVTVQKSPTQLAPQQPAADSKKSTSTSDNPCDSESPFYLSCGGEEVINSNDASVFTLVLNCVPAVSTYIAPRPPLFNFGVDLIAEYCCEQFYPKPRLYPGYECKKITTNVKIPQFTSQQFNDYMEGIFGKIGGHKPWYEKIKEFLNTPLW